MWTVYFDYTFLIILSDDISHTTTLSDPNHQRENTATFSAQLETGSYRKCLKSTVLPTKLTFWLLTQIADIAIVDNYNMKIPIGLSHNRFKLVYFSWHHSKLSKKPNGVTRLVMSEKASMTSTQSTRISTKVKISVDLVISCPTCACAMGVVQTSRWPLTCKGMGQRDWKISRGSGRLQ